MRLKWDAIPLLTMFTGFLLLLGTACQSNNTTPPPPPGRSAGTGSLSAAYKNPPPQTSTNPNANQPQTSSGPAPVTRWQVNVNDSTPMIGNKDALVTIVEFSDFQCPFCSKAGKQIKDLLKKPEYKNKVRVFFKHFPLSFHKDAHLAAQAAMAAHEQGKFWEMHDKLFANMRKLKRADLDTYAKQLKLNMAAFKLALDKGKYKKYVDDNMDEGTKVKVSGTPTIFVNGRKAQLKTIGDTIKDELKRNKGLVEKGLKGNALYERLLEGAKLDEMKKVDIFVGDAPAKGDDDLPVTVVAFGDFLCPSFGGGAAIILQVEEAYRGKVRIAFKHYPHHGMSEEIAKALTAAQEMGMFWPYYQKLLNNMGKLTPDQLPTYAEELGIDRKAFETTMKRGSVKAVVDSDTKAAKGIGLKNTVGFYANGIKIQSPSSFDGFKKIIDKILIKKGYKKESLPKGPPPAKFNLTKSPIKGPANAPVTIVEFSDFQCPFCSRQVKTIRQLTKAYGGKIRIAFKHFPLSFHKQAKEAAVASMAAHKQGKFWPYHDLMFRNYKDLKQGRSALIRFATDLKLDINQFMTDLDSPELKNAVEADMALGRRVGVSGTPAFYVNGVKLSAGGSFETLSKEINKILVKKGYKASELPKEPPPVQINIKNAPFKGGANAKVTLVEFSDFQCPFCGRAAKTINQLAKAYGDKIRVVFKQYPLSFHKDAHLAAQASLAAHAQGKFWEMHDLLFQNTRTLKRNHIDQYARQLSMDMGTFKKALDNATYKANVDNDMSEGTDVGVSGTPTLFINNKKHKGKFDFAGIKKAIDPILLKHGYKRSDLPKGPPLVKIKVGNAPFKGGANAKVTIVEFSDFQCPFCGRAAKVLDQFAKAYGDKVKLVFKQFPLSFHKDAHLAAQAALAAHAEGKFWQMHDLLFQNTRTLKRRHLEQYARQLSMDLGQFKAALDNATYKNNVDADMRQGGVVGVSGTPSVYINNKKFSKNLSFENLMQVVNPLLRRAGYPASALPQAPPAVKIDLSTRDGAKGPATAPVTIVEFSDFQCPFCGRATRPIEQIYKAYKGKVRVVFKHFPLNFHKDAHLAAQAALAAGAQGKFWEMHDLLFQNTRTLKRNHLDAYAKKLGLNMSSFKSALDSGTYKAQVDADMAVGRRVGVSGTPTIFVNGRKLMQNISFKAFQSLINPMLLKKGYKKADLPSGPPPVEVKLHGGEAWKGGKNAPVTIVEFSDFQCPFCSRGANTIEQVAKAYGNKVKLVFKHFPLNFHKDAPLAAQAAMAAQAQGKFWQMHDKLFANIRKLKRPDLERYAKELGLDMVKFKNALDAQAYKPVLDADMREGRAVGISGTPGFFINGQKISGAQPFNKFMNVINAILLKKGYKRADLPSGPPAK